VLVFSIMAESVAQEFPLGGGPVTLQVRAMIGCRVDFTSPTGTLAIFATCGDGAVGRAFPLFGWYDTLKTTGNRVSYTLDSTLDSVNTAEETAAQMAANRLRR